MVGSTYQRLAVDVRPMRRAVLCHADARRVVDLAGDRVRRQEDELRMSLLPSGKAPCTQLRRSDMQRRWSVAAKRVHEEGE